MGILADVKTLVLCTAVGILVGIGLGVARSRIARSPQEIAGEPPATLRETGLYADWDRKQLAPGVEPFTPQYPLWTDGAHKQRWIALPPGSVIDASAADAWQFPVGTRLWKEFSFGARTETRYMVRTRRGWRFATYVWNAGETEAVRVRDGAAAGEVAPGVPHRVPSEGECRACHGNAATPVLGFSALQLSGDRDPGALHREMPAPGSLDLPALVARGRLRGWPASVTAPRIPGAPVERAALGYLHANCGHCHRSEGAVASVGMVLAHALDTHGLAAIDTVIAKPSAFMAPQVRVAPGDAEHSVVLARMRSRSPLAQMPPLGTQLVDTEAVRLIARWIDQLAPSSQPGELL